MYIPHPTVYKSGLDGDLQIKMDLRMVEEERAGNLADIDRASPCTRTPPDMNHKLAVDERSQSIVQDNRLSTH